MTSNMCGIEPTNVKPASGWRVGGDSRSQSTERVGVVARRVQPLQGGDGLFGPSSQGVALGCCLVAPLARKTDATRKTDAMRVIGVAWVDWCANGAKPVSLGQRPRNRANHNMVCPERATPGRRAQARDLEQTIARNVAEILEA